MEKTCDFVYENDQNRCNKNMKTYNIWLFVQIIHWKNIMKHSYFVYYYEYNFVKFGGPD